MLYFCSMVNITENKEYIIVRIDNAKFNVEGILSKILDKSYMKYWMLKDRMTIFYKGGNQSCLAHGLNKLIKYAENDGIWYSNIWSTFGGYKQVMNTLFYDEFIFLLSEDLIKFDDVELLTMDDIWRNFDYHTQLEETPFLKSLLDCKNKIDLKKEYRKLVMEYHPDKTGSDNDEIRQITAIYLKLFKSF